MKPVPQPEAPGTALELIVTALYNRARIYNLIGEANKSLADFQRAMAMCRGKRPEDITLRAEITIDMASALALGGRGRARRIAEGAIKLLLKRIDPVRQHATYLRALNCLGTIVWYTGNFHKALRFQRRALAMCERSKDQKIMGQLHGNIGNAHLRLGELRSALKHYKLFLKVMEQQNDKAQTAVALGCLGVVHGSMGKFNAAARYFKNGLIISQQIGYRTSEAAAYGNIGIVYSILGKLRRALEQYQKYYQISKATGFSHGMGIAASNIGLALTNLGDLNGAADYYRRYLDISQKTRNKMGIAEAYTGLGNLYLLRRDTARAEQYLRRAMYFSTRSGNEMTLATVHCNFSELYFIQKNMCRSIYHSHKALDIVEKTGSKEEILIALRAKAKSVSMSDPKQAMLIMGKVLAIAKEDKRAIELGISCLETARILGRMRQTKRAVPYLKLAKRIFARTGACYWSGRAGELEQAIRAQSTA